MHLIVHLVSKKYVTCCKCCIKCIDRGGFNFAINIFQSFADFAVFVRGLCQQETNTALSVTHAHQR